jgi:hypothetical protein
MTTDVDLLLVTPLFWLRFFRIRRGASVYVRAPPKLGLGADRADQR